MERNEKEPVTKPLSPAAIEDLRRLYSYGWLPGHIARIFNRMHGLTLTTAEIKRLRRELNRAEICGENTAPDGEADAGK